MLRRAKRKGIPINIVPLLRSYKLENILKTNKLFIRNLGFYRLKYFELLYSVFGLIFINT